MDVITTIERISHGRFAVESESRTLLQTEIGRFVLVLDLSRDHRRRMVTLQRRWMDFLKAELRVDARTKRFPCARNKMVRYLGSIRSVDADGGTRKVVFYGVECRDGRRLEGRYRDGTVYESVFLEDGFFVRLLGEMER